MILPRPEQRPEPVQRLTRSRSGVGLLGTRTIPNAHPPCPWSRKDFSFHPDWTCIGPEIRHRRSERSGVRGWGRRGRSRPLRWRSIAGSSCHGYYCCCYCCGWRLLWRIGCYCCGGCYCFSLKSHFIIQLVLILWNRVIWNYLVFHVALNDWRKVIATTKPKVGPTNCKLTSYKGVIAIKAISLGILNVARCMIAFDGPALAHLTFRPIKQRVRYLAWKVPDNEFPIFVGPNEIIFSSCSSKLMLMLRVQELKLFSSSHLIFLSFVIVAWGVKQNQCDQQDTMSFTSFRMAPKHALMK